MPTVTPPSVPAPEEHGPIRTLVHLLGLDDPAQVLAAGPMPGGLLADVAKRFPRFAKAIQTDGSRAGRPNGTGGGL